ncbi:hypothetical protein FPV67DRAFT_1209365 [Lyophyllum atratum]|nr:hypothetical protein FPV67DRAFT_1209365 [Lyophyllum atratum]
MSILSRLRLRFSLRTPLRPPPPSPRYLWRLRTADSDRFLSFFHSSPSAVHRVPRPDHYRPMQPLLVRRIHAGSCPASNYSWLAPSAAYGLLKLGRAHPGLDSSIELTRSGAAIRHTQCDPPPTDMFAWKTGTDNIHRMQLLLNPPHGHRYPFLVEIKAHYPKDSHRATLPRSLKPQLRPRKLYRTYLKLYHAVRPV